METEPQKQHLSIISACVRNTGVPKIFSSSEVIEKGKCGS